MGLPKTAFGLVGLFIFVGWIINLMLGTESPLSSITNIATEAQTNIVESSEGLTLESGILGALTAVFSIIFNVVVILFSFLAGIFISFAAFVAATLSLPIVISQMLIAVLSVGLIFSLIKLFVPEN